MLKEHCCEREPNYLMEKLKRTKWKSRKQNKKKRRKKSATFGWMWCCSPASAPSAGMLAHSRGWPVQLRLWCSCAMPDSGASVWITFALAFENNIRYPDTAHQRNYYRQCISCVSAIPDFETFQSFRRENPLCTGARAVSGWRDFRQLASSENKNRS